eukprot:CAMPEP_0206207846 /NCGR_PEP_ID=MMETSP0166-20121206/15838_1 /ASSEMBLY_ACC=CAM_ASM_000260 /TAXON_ID=95228 /ORGANISM="Vannella robusta, Strain DIVA3 518/3/11/1/6" /LENGTH=146 /DNA_ID=CAMNT_0053628693 /DNA_START=110 /DNA_END=547 /DNA_ORIENTATION=+
MKEGSKRESEERKRQARARDGEEEELGDLLGQRTDSIKERVEEGLENSVWNAFQYEDSDSAASEASEEDSSSVTLNFDAYAELSGNKRRGNRRKRLPTKKKAKVNTNESSYTTTAPAPKPKRYSNQNKTQRVTNTIAPKPIRPHLP